MAVFLLGWGGCGGGGGGGVNMVCKKLFVS